MQYMVAESITEAVVVGHSVSGVWLQLLLGQVPERISRICFLNAIVLKTGESFISNSVGPAQVTLNGGTLLHSKRGHTASLQILEYTAVQWNPL